MKLALMVGAVVSVGNFDEVLVTPEGAALQQTISLGMWTLIAGASYFVPRRIRLRPWTDLAFGLAFYAFAALSVMWSGLLPTSIAKSAALLITTFGCYRLALGLTIDEIVDCVIWALAAQCAASVAFAVFVPEIGVVQVWMHNGQWSGIFESKQSLGTVGAFLIFFSSYRLLSGGRWLPFLLTFSLAVASVVGSGSRGGGATALAAVAILYLVRRSPRLGAVFAFGPLVMTAIACALIAHLYSSDNPYFMVWGEKIDLTERTFIWHHALQHFEARAPFGYGLNGFWSIDAMAHAFKREHGWVLDNYHSGYLTILMETGLVGLTLFSLWFMLFGMKMKALLRWQALPPGHLQLVIAFMNLMFIFNFTETFFLRATNLLAVLMAAFFFISSQALTRRADRPARITLPDRPPATSIGGLRPMGRA